MAARGLLITGTDTGVGKTFVGCGLLAAIRDRGIGVAPFKPAESGCARDPHSRELIPVDAEALRQASQTNAALDLICPYRFEAPLAPWLAAEREGKSIHPSRLVECYRQLASTHDFVVVETAGGILVPLAGGFNYGDLARLLDLPVLVVVGSKLGVINHTLLTLEFLRRSGLRVIGCVLNHPYAERDLAVETNEDILRRLVPEPFFVAPRAAHRGTGIAPARVFDELADHCLTALS